MFVSEYPEVIAMQIQDVDLKLLQVFNAIVHCGGFAAAQSTLNVSGSRISEYMSQLETRVGVRLCERGRGGFRLTEDGIRFHESAQRLLGAINTFQMEASGLRKKLRGTVLFGLIEATMTDVQSPLLPALRNFVRDAPEIYLHVAIDTPAALEQRVLDGRLHLAVAPFKDKLPGLSYRSLYHEEQLLYCASPHPLYSCPAGAEQAEEIRRSRLAMRSYLGGRELSLLQVSEPAASVDNVEGRAMLILSGNYVGFLPAHYANPWEEKGLLRRVNPQRMRTKLEFKIICRRGQQPARAVQCLLDHLVAAGDRNKKAPKECIDA
jgi:LysR family transcriptional regulator, transcriptional activator for bauABCD operon